MPSPEALTPVPTVPDLLNVLTDIQRRRELNDANENVIERTLRGEVLFEQEAEIHAAIEELNSTRQDSEQVP